MRDYISLGCTTPPDEKCVQVGTENYMKLSKIEANAYVDQLVRTMGPMPADARFKITRNEHDHGPYLTVDVTYTSPEGADYAFKCEGEGPTEWDETAKAQLKEAGYALK